MQATRDDQLTLMTNDELARSPYLRSVVRSRLKDQKKRFKAKTGQTGKQMRQILGWGAGIWCGVLYGETMKVRFTTERVEMLTRYMGGDIEAMLAFPDDWEGFAPEPLLPRLRFASNEDAGATHAPPADLALHQAPDLEGPAERCPFNVALLAEQMTEQEVCELTSIHSEEMSIMNLTTLVTDLTDVLCKRVTQTEMALESPTWV